MNNMEIEFLPHLPVSPELESTLSTTTEKAFLEDEKNLLGVVSSAETREDDAASLDGTESLSVSMTEELSSGNISNNSCCNNSIARPQPDVEEDVQASLPQVQSRDESEVVSADHYQQRPFQDQPFKDELQQRLKRIQHQYHTCGAEEQDEVPEVQEESDYDDEEEFEDSIEVQLGPTGPFECEIEPTISFVTFPSRGRSFLFGSEEVATTTATASAITKENSQARRRVCFCLERNQYFQPPSLYQDMSDDEFENCWYAKDSREIFKDDSIEAAKEVFLKKKKTTAAAYFASALLLPSTSFFTSSSFFSSWFQAKKLEFNPHADYILNAYDACSEPEMDMEMQQDNNNSSNIHNKNPAINEEILSEKHQQRLKFRTALREMYKTTDEMPGLEHFILTPFRGEPESLRSFVLEQAYYGWRRKGSLLSRKTSLSLSRSKGSRSEDQEQEEDTLERLSSDEEARLEMEEQAEVEQRLSLLTPQQLQQQMEEEEQMAHSLALISRCISRPSRLLAHELAKALADALQQDLEEEKTKTTMTTTVTTTTTTTTTIETLSSVHNTSASVH
ncbi:hypothetical protein ACA910_008293 [Epithemia clementina (nom. ined.)]